MKTGRQILTAWLSPELLELAICEAQKHNKENCEYVLEMEEHDETTPGDVLCGLFYWDRTPQGYSFWDKVALDADNKMSQDLQEYEIELCDEPDIRDLMETRDDSEYIDRINRLYEGGRQS